MNELVLDVPGQISQVEKAEAAESQQKAQAAGVIAWILRLRLVLSGRGIRRRARLIGDDGARPAEAAHAHRWCPGRLFQRDFVTWLERCRSSRGSTLVSLNQER